jgi:hypothetical protein
VPETAWVCSNVGSNRQFEASKLIWDKYLHWRNSECREKNVHSILIRWQKPLKMTRIVTIFSLRDLFLSGIRDRPLTQVWGRTNFSVVNGMTSKEGHTPKKVIHIHSHPDTQAIFTSVASFNALTKSDTIQWVSRPVPSTKEPLPAYSRAGNCHLAVLLSVWT